MTEPRILTLDVETKPIEAHIWGLYDLRVGINQIMSPTRVICWAAKWHGKPKIHFMSEFHDDPAAMVQGIYDLWNSADVIVHFNGTSFDLPHLRREFLVAGMSPPKPVQEIDLLRVAKGQFKFPSNKLAYITQYLSMDTKLSHSGHDLWVRCLQGDPAAWSVMRRYNKQDVKVTEDLYDRLQPWVRAHPHVGLFAGDAMCCSNCGSNDLEKRGFKYTATSAFQQYLCRDCGKWLRGAKSVARVETRSA